MIEHDGEVAVVTLNRPRRLNALSPRLDAELRHALVALDAEPTVRAIVVTGAGAAFCMGIDPREGGGPATADGRRARDRRKAAMGLREVPPWQLRTPVIGAINGAAVGVGLTLPLQWDIRVVAADAELSLPLCRRGLIPEANSLWLLPRLVGLSRALQIMLVGDPFSGADAVAWGLATEALPRPEVLPRARAIAAAIATDTSPAAVTLVKQLAYRFLTESDRDRAHEEERRAFAWIAAQPDVAEGLRAFRDGRAPNWQTSKSHADEWERGDEGAA